MKRTVLLLLFFFTGLSLSAQGGLLVSSFRPLEHDLTANTAGTMEMDQNGETAALIKVVTTQTGFHFENGMMGIVKTVQRPSEIWVYVPARSRKISIMHSQLGQIRDYEFPCSIEAGRTYELVLVSGEVVTTVKKDKGGNMLAVTVQPAGATFFINDEIKTLNAGQFVQFYPYGEYTYRVEATGFMPDAGAFTIRPEEKTTLEISLKSALATLSVVCPTQGCEIYVNEERKGIGSYSSQVVDGMYLIEVKKQGYRSHQETVTLAKQEQRSVSIPALSPIYGSLMVSVQPVDADIYIDEVKRGKCPEIIEDILVGEHEVKISMIGYKGRTERITIAEDERSELSGSLEAIPVAAAVPVGGGGSSSGRSSSSAGGGSGTIAGYEYVDLGLPSGLLWATCNIGASSPSDDGGYYAWGETSTKGSYEWSNLKYWTSGDSYENVTFSKYVASSKYGTVDNKTRLEMSDDAARANWGGSWRMPTKDEWRELKKSCTWEWTSQGGHNGYKVTGKNGNSIFLPASGYRNDAGLDNVGSCGAYWSSSLDPSSPYYAYYCHFNSDYVLPYNNCSRDCGFAVRPVSPSSR